MYESVGGLKAPILVPPGQRFSTGGRAQSKFLSVNKMKTSVKFPARHIEDLFQIYTRLGESLEVLRGFQTGSIAAKDRKELGRIGVKWLKPARERLKEIMDDLRDSNSR
jgi:hypothetical protein